MTKQPLTAMPGQETQGLPRGPEAETQHLLSDGRENRRLLNSMIPCNQLTFSGCHGLSKYTFSNWSFFPVTKQFF